MIRHLVLFRFIPEASSSEIAALISAFRALPAAIPEVLSFEDGTNISPEGLADGFTHAFLMAFADTAARDTYLVHPAHQAFVVLTKMLVAQALVFDYAL